MSDQSGLMVRFAERIEAIEARQRDHKMHDPDCPIRRYDRHDARGMTASIRTESCNCWLSDKPKDIPNPPTPQFIGSCKLLIGDNKNRSFNITHNLGSKEVYLGRHQIRVQSVVVISTGLNLLDTDYAPRVTHRDLNTLTLHFPPGRDAPPSNGIEVTIISEEKQ